MTGSQHRALLRTITHLEQRITQLEAKTMPVTEAMLEDAPETQKLIADRQRETRRNIFWP